MRVCHIRSVTTTSKWKIAWVLNFSFAFLNESLVQRKNSITCENKKLENFDRRMGPLVRWLDEAIVCNGMLLRVYGWFQFIYATIYYRHWYWEFIVKVKITYIISIWFFQWKEYFESLPTEKRERNVNVAKATKELLKTPHKYIFPYRA